MKKTITIIGASGFLGKPLCRFFLEQGYHVKGFTRDPFNYIKLKNMNVEPIPWDGQNLNGWEKHLEETDTIINLAGESIGTSYWTKKKKNHILSSRQNTGKLISRALHQIEKKPNLFIQVSAVGFYKTDSDEEMNEQSPKGDGFLPDVVTQWESSTSDIEKIGIKRIICRLGIVLGKNGGALKQMILPFKLFIGGRLGTGKQWISWIHIEDMIHSMDFLMNKPDCEGVYNFTSPFPIRNYEFAKTLGKIMKRPSFLPTPSFIIKLLMGEMGTSLLLKGQRVLPLNLTKEGFIFQYPHLENAIAEILS